jgi:iron complex transport system substrate-binding protein
MTHRFSQQIALVVVICLLAISLAPISAQDGSALDANITEGCAESYDADVNYFPEQLTVDYTAGFAVEYFNNYKLVTVTSAWFGAQPFQYVLVQCGTPAPEDDSLAGATVIEVPINTIATMSTTYLPALDILNRVDTIVAHDEFDFVYNENVRARIDAEELTEIGGGSAVNVELVLDLEPDVVMTYGIGIADYDAHPALIEAGLPVVLNGDYLEASPLARAEWLKFMALFYNLEGEGQRWFDETVTAYEELAALGADVESRPTVYLNSAFEGTWYMPGGQSFMAQILNDAGADYLWADDDTTGSLFLDFESVYDMAGAAEYWINPNGFWFTLEDAVAADARYGDFAAYQNNMVYNNTLRMSPTSGNDFYESGALRPQDVLADLIAILHPELMPDHEFVYYQQLLPAAQ